MLRYLRLYANFVRFSFSRAMEFRFDFFFRVVMDMIFYAVNLTFFAVIYNHVDDIAGWSQGQALVFVAGYLFIDALDMTLFANNNWAFPHLVNKGDLDYYLVRPVSTFFFISLRDFAANSFLNLVMTLGLLAWTIANCGQEISLAAAALYLGMLVLGTFLHHAVFMFFLIPVFWAHQVEGLRSLGWGINQLSQRPHRVYAPWLKRVLMTIVPAALWASVPAYVLFEGLSWGTGLNFIGVLVGVYAVLMMVWRMGMRAYSSASS